MENKLLDFPSFSDQPERKPAPAIPSFGQAQAAQYGELLAPVWEQNSFYTAPTYEEDAAEVVENEIAKRPYLSETEALQLRNFGTSRKAINDTLRSIDESRARRETIANLGAGTAYFSSPTFGVDLLLLTSGVGAPFVLSKMASAARLTATSKGLKETSRRVLTGEGVGVREAGKIGAFYGAVPPIVVGTVETLSSQTKEDAIRNAQETALETLFSTAIGAVAGASVAKVFGGRTIASEHPIVDIDNNTTLEIAQKKLTRNIEEVKNPNLKPSAAVARRKRNKALSESYTKFIDDVSGDEVSPPAVGFKNQKLLKFVTGAVPTSLRGIINSNLPDSFKSAGMRLGADLGLVSTANQAGIPSEMSVHLRKAMRSKDWAKAEMKMNEAYQEVNPRRSQTFMGSQVLNSVEKVRKLVGKDSYTLEDWYDLVGKTVLRNTPIDQIPSEPLKKAVIAYREFMLPHTKELSDLGIINSKELFAEKLLKASGKQGELVAVSKSIIRANRKWMEKAITKLKADDVRFRGLNKESAERLKELEGLKKLIDEAESFDNLIAIRKKLDLTPRMASALSNLDKSIKQLADQIDSYKSYLDQFEDPPKDKVHFPIVYKRDAIRKNREAFEAILRSHFSENNVVTQLNEETLLIEKIELSTDPANVADRARRAVDTILGETDEDDIEMMMSGIGRSGMLGSRRMNVPAEKMEDFIVTDIKDIMVAYSDRVGGRIEFHKAFKNPITGKAQALDDILEQLRLAAKSEGASDKEVDKGIMQFVSLYDTVVGSPLKNPDAISNKIAETLRSVTNLTFLGRAGVAAVGDASTIFMDNDLATIGKVFLSPLSDEKPLSKNAKELRMMGDLLEISRGMAHTRFMEGMSSSPFIKSNWDKANNAFYNLNGLNFVTMATKNMEGLARGHTVIERSIKLAEGKATKFETEFLARYMIDAQAAKKIAAQPFEKTKNGLILPNSSEWADEATKETFQAAIRAGVANRIIMGTPADKPNMMNGFAYFRKETAEKWGLPIVEDSRVPGYVRYESGLMTIPFAFYTYTFGALTKITGNYAQGAVQNKSAHVAASLILGGLIVKYRTPDFVWNDMSMQDKAARALDFSGLAAMHTDLAYRTLAMANEFGANVDSFPIKPKFDGGFDPTGGAVSIAGAPADYVYGLTQSLNDVMTGNFSEGAKQFINHIPFIGAMAFMGTIKDTLKALVPSE